MPEWITGGANVDEVSPEDFGFFQLAEENVVSLNFASWNQLDGWLRQLERLRRVA